MKLTTTLLLSSTIALATANTSSSWKYQALTDEPQFKYDPNTISPCVLWYNNIGIESCEYTRSGFDISPEDFHKWNPSVGLDCKPWNVGSYCLVSEGKLASFKATASKAASTSSKSAAETASSKTGPITTSSKVTSTAVTTTTATVITTSKQSSGAVRNRGVFI
ncbi:hypothetical protein J3E68DRAFT_447801 [Trichoderma sp. SZMC 28012]